ncbi:MAG: type I secretion C-terminal target domain-containing protein [Pseudomonadota bacterium]
MSDVRPAASAQKAATGSEAVESTAVAPATRLSTADLLVLAKSSETEVVILDDGRLALKLQNGLLLPLENTRQIVSDFAEQSTDLLDVLATSPELLASVIRVAKGEAPYNSIFSDLADAVAALSGPNVAQPDTDEKTDGDAGAPTAGSGEPDADEKTDGDAGAPTAGSGEPDARAVSTPSLGDGQAGTLNGGGISFAGQSRRDDTRLGKDDLPHGEAGSSGELVQTGVGTPIKHLVGLTDEERGLRNGERATETRTAHVDGNPAGVGSSIRHLGVLGNTEYYRSTDEPVTDTAVPGTFFPIIIPNPFNASATEDTPATGQLYDVGQVIIPITTYSTNLPAGTGAFTINPDGTYTYVPAAHVSGPVSFELTYTDPRDGKVQTIDVNIDVGAVADPADVTGSATGKEDTPIPFAINVASPDQDGSERVETVKVSNIPAGATVTWPATYNSVITTNADGTLSFNGTEAEIQAALQNLTIDPPKDFSGDITLNVEVTTVENNADPSLPGFNDRNTVTKPFVISVTPVVDNPAITGAAEVVEDQTVDFGKEIDIEALDATDGSEGITKIELGGIPQDATVTFSAEPGVSVTSSTVGGVTTYTIEATNPNAGKLANDAAIRKTLESFKLTPPEDSDKNIDVSVTVTKDDSGVTDTSTGTLPIKVKADVDGAVIAGQASGNEDADIGLPIEASLTDDDGSETYDWAEITVPSGVTLIVPPTLPNGITQSNVGGVPRFTPGAGTTPQQFEDFLKNDLKVKAPADSNTDFDVGVKISVTETNLDVNGEVQTATKAVTANIPVKVAPVADLPVIGGSSVADEDQGEVKFGEQITITQNDTDGSEQISEIVLGGFPSGVVATFTKADPAVSVVYDATAGTYTISGGTDQQIRDTLKSFKLDLSQTAYDHNADDIDLSVKVTKTDKDDTSTATDSASITGSHKITINAVADAPTVAGDTKTTPEDTKVQLTNLAAGLVDTDGSETLSLQITGVDKDAKLLDENGAEYPFVTVGSGAGQTKTYTIPNSAISNTGADKVWFEPPADANGTFGGMKIVATATEGAVAGESTADDVATNSADITVTVTPVVDPPVISGASSVDEDDEVAFGGNIGITNPDSTDGSEGITKIVLGDIPSDATVTFGTVAGATVTSTTTAGVTTYTIEATDPNASPAVKDAAIRALLATAKLTPPEHTDDEITVAVAVTKVDENQAGGADATTTTSGTHAITVAAVVDGATLTGTASGDEDQPIDLALTADLIDDDGTEVYTYADVTPPSGVSLIFPATLPNGITVETITGGHRFKPGAATTPAQFEAFLANDLQVKADTTHDADDYDVDVTIRVTETASNGNQLTGPAAKDVTTTVNVKVNAIADPPTVAGDTKTTDEDTTVQLTNLSGALVDTDTSETLTYEISGIDKDAQLLNGATGTEYSFVLTGPAGNQTKTYTIPATAIKTGNTPDDVWFKPPAQEHGTFTGTIKAIATETAVAGENTSDDVASTTAPITITVNPVVDPATIGTGSSVTIEDTEFALGDNLDIDVADKDNSQTIKVSLTNVLAEGTPTYTADPAVSVVQSGTTWTFDGPTTNILALIESFKVTPPKDTDGNYDIGISVVTTDANGQSATTNGTHRVTVKADADAPSLSITGAGDEDTFIKTPITTAVTDTDGTEEITKVEVSGIPTETAGQGDASSDPGAQVRFVNGAGTQTVAGNFNGTFSGQDASGNAFTVTGDGSGKLTFTGTDAGIRAAVASLEIKRGDHVGDDFTLSVAATATETTPTTSTTSGDPDNPGGEIETASRTTTATHTVDVKPVIDGARAFASDLSGDEDQPIKLNTNGFRHELVDNDGSQVVYYYITGLENGGRITNAAGQRIGTKIGTNANGTYRLTEAEFAEAHFDPDQNRHTDTSGEPGSRAPYELTFQVVTDESENIDVNNLPANPTDWPAAGRASVDFKVETSPTPDGVRFQAKDTEFNEDTIAEFGKDILFNGSTSTNLFAKRDNDGSEEVTEVRLELNSLPTGWLVQYDGTTTFPANVSESGGIYTITGTGSTVADREASIRATLDKFQLKPAEHSDENVDVRVRVVTKDQVDNEFNTAANGNEDNDTRTNTRTHKIITKAVADAPEVTAGFTINGSEGAPIFLTSNGAQNGTKIQVSKSDDTNGGTASATEGPEVLSVEISGFPLNTTLIGDTSGGGALAKAGNTAYKITGTEAQIQAILDSLQVTYQDFSGTVTLTVKAISTETATGSGEIAQETAEDVAQIEMTVGPVADEPTVKGNAIGTEDSRISIPIAVTLGDKDGSESYKMQITNVPDGGDLYVGATKLTPISGTGAGRVYELTPAQVQNLSIQPPEHYSSAQQGDIQLSATTIVTDTDGTNTDTQSFGPTTIPVIVTGVADKPNVNPVSITEEEDEPIELGDAIVASLGGNLNSALVDQDGSESLSFVIKLPAGTIPSKGTYIGGGNWQVDAADVPGLTIPTKPDFSGDLVSATGMSVRAVTQEKDGDDNFSEVDLTITITPKADGDGFSSWTPDRTVTEDNDISLASIANHTSADADGSESVVEYRIELKDLIADAEIGAVTPNLGDFLANHVTGTYTMDGTTMVVQAANISGITFKKEAFKDSNVDFGLPVDAIVEDGPGGPRTTETTSFDVNLVGDADEPTVFINATSGQSGVAFDLDLGGDNTDTDSDLGRTESEGEIYYILNATSQSTPFPYGLVDSSGDAIGLQIAPNSYYLTKAEIDDVKLLTNVPGGGTIDFSLTTVVVENDGDLAQKTTDQDVTITVTANPNGPTQTPPQPPTLTINPSNGNEGASVTLDVTAAPQAGDPTDPSVAVIISAPPAGITITNGVLNPLTGEYIVPSGQAQVSAPADFSGDVTLQVRAVATGKNLATTTVGPQPAIVNFDPVADGPSITANPTDQNEDTDVPLNLTIAARDTDATPETVDNAVFIKPAEGTLVNAAGTAIGTLLTSGPNAGFYQLTKAEAEGARLRPVSGKHGSVTVEVKASTTEPTDNADGDHTQTTTETFTVNIEAVADIPNVTVPATPITGDEDTDIEITGLSVASADPDTSEVVSARIVGVPDGTKFSAGSNNGDGSWTIPVASLAGLKITPPTNYSGTMTLTLQAFALELSNGDVAETPLTANQFQVEVAPVADSVKILAKDATVDANAFAELDFNVRADDETGTTAGENPAETVRITFTSVPDTAEIWALGGGTVTDQGNGTWQFEGTEAQSNALAISPGDQTPTGLHLIGMSVVTVDGTSVSAPVTDSFRLTVNGASDARSNATGDATDNTLTGGGGADLLSGLGGNDTLSGLGGADFLLGGGGNDILLGGDGDDVLNGGAGLDTMTGGAGEDQFKLSDLPSGGTDTITDFTVSDDDVLDVSALMTGYDDGTSDLSDFLQTTESGGDTTVRIDRDGAENGVNFVDLVVLEGNTGLNLETLETNGNLVTT